jgi:uncharacterized protein GlcG (DUF336 family)
MPRKIWALTQSDASFLIDHATKAAQEQGIAVTVAVVEHAGITVGLLRMDGTKLASVRVAETKAWTAAVFQRASGDYAAPTAPGGGAYGMLNAFPSQFVPVFGGQPILFENSCIGGIGVSGGSSDQDDSIARAAASALLSKASDR